jgi:CheY-like chemotaxis protein
LVVEDDDDIREIFAQILEEAGYVVTWASNGRDALKRLRSGGPLPGVIFLDLMMPIMDGYAFCAEKMADPAIAQVPVVVMSADGRAQPKLEGFAVQAFLRKPLTIRAILDAAERFHA